jgi:hypothetical protein
MKAGQDATKRLAKITQGLSKKKNQAWWRRRGVSAPERIGGLEGTSRHSPVAAAHQPGFRASSRSRASFTAPSEPPRTLSAS